MKEAKLRCRECGRDMMVSFDESCPVEYLDKLVSCVTCDDCMVRLGRAKRDDPSNQVNLPYKDL